MAKVTSNHPGLEAALRNLHLRIDALERIARRDIHVGPGLRSLHQSEDTLLLQSKGGGGSGGGGSCKKWVPRKTTKEGTTFLTFQTGTINGIRPSNMGEPIAYSVPGDDPLFIQLKTTTAGNTTEITASTIVIQTDNLVTTEDAEGAPPGEFYTHLGTIVGNKITMDVCYSLSALPKETRRTAKTVVEAGREPFERWYQWSVRELLEE